MTRSTWLSAEARKTLAGCVKAIEEKTAAEVVVTVRDRSDTYRHVDVATGTALAALMLAVYVYFPVDFPDAPAPAAIVLAFVGGVLLSAAVDPLKRLFVTKAARRRAVRLSARAAFVDQGIGATVARTGILVYVSLFEREVEVVADVGVDVMQMGEAWTSTVAAIEACARAGATPEQLGSALKKLSEPLAQSMPRRANDVNELPDEVVT
jgi:putative membrane protein